MSKERARRREVRQAEAARRTAAADARSAKQVARRRRKDRRRSTLRTVLPRRRWSRRTREQRAITVAVLLAIGAGAYVLLDSWSLRIAVVLVALLALPAVTTLILDRSTR